MERYRSKVVGIIRKAISDYLSVLDGLNRCRAPERDYLHEIDTGIPVIKIEVPLLWGTF